MEKLILERDREDFYILEVNDKGETIEFDLTDMGLIERVMNAGDELVEVGKRYEKKEQEIIEKYKDDNTEAVRQLIKLDKEHDKELRKKFDSFLGDGACQKIFGNSRNVGQYNRLLEALEPHFEKIKIKSDKAKAKLINRYKNKRNDVL